MACPICKNTNINNFFSLKDYEYNINSITEYSICELCAIIYRNTDIKEEDEKLLYSKEIYKPVKGGLIYNYLKKINAYYEKYNIFKYLPKDNPYEIKTILDIACGKGYLLEEFAKNRDFKVSTLRDFVKAECTRSYTLADVEEYSKRCL